MEVDRQSGVIFCILLRLFMLTHARARHEQWVERISTLPYRSPQNYPPLHRDFRAGIHCALTNIDVRHEEWSVTAILEDFGPKAPHSGIRRREYAGLEGSSRDEFSVRPPVALIAGVESFLVEPMLGGAAQTRWASRYDITDRFYFRHDRRLSGLGSQNAWRSAGREMTPSPSLGARFARKDFFLQCYGGRDAVARWQYRSRSA